LLSLQLREMHTPGRVAWWRQLLTIAPQLALLFESEGAGEGDLQVAHGLAHAANCAAMQHCE
jgi:hypothetical protein